MKKSQQKGKFPKSPVQQSGSEKIRIKGQLHYLVSQKKTKHPSHNHSTGRVNQQSSAGHVGSQLVSSVTPNTVNSCFSLIAFMEARKPVNMQRSKSLSQQQTTARITAAKNNYCCAAHANTISTP